MAGVTAASGLATAGNQGGTDLARQSAEWLALDRQIERLSLRWARLEAVVVHEAGGDMSLVTEMAAIETRLSGLSDARESRLQALSQCPARTLHEAACKLAVAARRMADEGGPEHDIVADAVRVLSGLADPPTCA